MIKRSGKVLIAFCILSVGMAGFFFVAAAFIR